MHKPKGFYLWLVAVSLLLPLMEFVVFAIVYGTFMEQAIQISTCYIPISMVSGALLLYLMMSTTNKKGKKHIFGWYIASLIVTIIVSILLKDLSHWFVANLIGGVIILGMTFFAYATKPRTSSFHV